MSLSNKWVMMFLFRVHFVKVWVRKSAAGVCFGREVWNKVRIEKGIVKNLGSFCGVPIDQNAFWVWLTNSSVIQREVFISRWSRAALGSSMFLTFVMAWLQVFDSRMTSINRKRASDVVNFRKAICMDRFFITNFSKNSFLGSYGFQYRCIVRYTDY